MLTPQPIHFYTDLPSGNRPIGNYSFAQLSFTGGNNPGTRGNLVGPHHLKLQVDSEGPGPGTPQTTAKLAQWSVANPRGGWTVVLQY
jgi:hypothetical protein